MSNYEKNMTAMEKLVPAIAKWIEEEKPKTWVEKIRSETGGMNLLVKHDNGKKYPVYNMHTPMKEVKAIVKHAEFHRNNCSVIVGLGCGYLTRALLKKKDKKHVVVVVEPVADFYKVAFDMFNYSKFILAGEVIFVPTLDDLVYILHSIENRTVIENWMVTVDTYARNRSEYKDLITKTFNQIASLRCNTGTVEGAGELIAKNDIESLPYIIRKRGVVELTGLFKGKPAICIATGPSLEKNIHLLLDPKVREKFVILAVGQALRVLLAYDIKPDLATSVDFGPVNFSHYKGLLDCGVPLVALNRSYSKLLQNWQGPLFACVSDTTGYEESVSGVINAKGTMVQGGSVAHMNYGLANAMGCNPVILIGQDLAWEGNKTHTRLADEMGTVKHGDDGSIGWGVDDPNTVIEGGGQAMGSGIQVMGYYGKPVFTNVGLLSFINSFEQIFSSVPNRTINATEGGAKIKGSDQMSLQEAIDEFGKEPIDKSVLQPLLSEAENADELELDALGKLTSDIDNMRQIIIECKAGIKAANKLSKAKLSNQLKKKYLADNERHSIKASELSKTNALIMISIFKASRAISHRDLMPKASVHHLIQNKKDMKTRIKRNKQILQAALAAAEKFIPLYEEALKLTEARVPAPKSEPMPDLKDVDGYFEKDNWAHPLLDAKRILSNVDFDDEPIWYKANDIREKAEYERKRTILAACEAYADTSGSITVKFNDLIEGAQKAGRDDKDYKTALEKLEQALEMKPDELSVKWGLASTYHLAGNVDKSLKYYKELIDDDPGNTQYRFERATVNLLANNIKEALDEFGVVMGSTDKFNHFYKSLAKICFKAGLYDEALTSIDMYLKHYAADFEGWDVKGTALEKLGRDEDAKKAYERAEKIKGI